MELRNKKVVSYKPSLVRFSKVIETKYYFISQKEKNDKIKCYDTISKLNDLE